MTLRVLIVDDEPLARSRLRRLLADCREPEAVVAGEAGDAPQAMSMLQRQEFDLALLDVHMPGASGMQLAAMLSEWPLPPAVVFVTAHAEHAVEAFEIDAVDYLTKPVRLERLQAALHKVARLRRLGGGLLKDAEADALIIAERSGTRRVLLADVLYLKAEQKYVTVRTRDASLLLDDSLNQLEERFAERFLRVHRNALVARNAIRGLVRHGAAGEGDSWAVELAGVHELLAVSRRQLPVVRAELGQ